MDKSETTKRVRIRVAICPDGQWSAGGHSGQSDEEMTKYLFIDNLPGSENFYWVEAEIPVPSSDSVIEGDVS